MKCIGAWMLLLPLQLLTLQAQDRYLLYDATCMDRLEYVNKVTAEAEYTYSFKLGEDRFVTFDMGREEFRRQEELSGKLTTCQSMTFDKALVNSLYEGKSRLFIAVMEQERYQVAPVLGASFFAREGTTVDCIVDGTSIRLFTETLFVRTDLGDTLSGREVFLDGTVRQQCMTGYRFQVRDGGAGAAASRSYLYVPALGLVERGTVPSAERPDGTSAAAVTWRLSRVGPLSLDETLTLLCDRRQAAGGKGAIAVTVPASDAVPAAPEAAGATSADPCAPSTVPGIHIVRKGETIYAISRQYGVSVADIMAWNQLSGTVIGVCSPLYVRNPAATVRMDTIVPVSVAKGTEAGVEEYWLDAPPVYTVKPGETVAALARRFGYTEARFRRMNALRPSDTIFPGQALRTTDCVCPGDLSATASGPPVPAQPADGSETGAPADPTDVYFKPVRIHLVQQTETLFGIARQYGTTAERLRELNGMEEAEQIRPGQRIYVQ